MSTIFGQIIEGKIPSKKVFENERILAIEDLHPVAPVHVLIMPKKEIRSIQAMKKEDYSLVAEIIEVAQKIAQEKGIHPSDVRHVIQSFLDKMTDSLSHGNRLEFRDFGVFEVVKRKQKIGRNPKNAAVPIIIPARLAVKFTPGKKMRKLIDSDDESVPEEQERERE